MYRTCFHLRRHAKHSQSAGTLPVDRPVPTLLSTYSVHDFHNYGLQGTGMTPGLHFHLAASVNAETGEFAGCTEETLSNAVVEKRGPFQIFRSYRAW